MLLRPRAIPVDSTTFTLEAFAKRGLCSLREFQATSELPGMGGCRSEPLGYLLDGLIGSRSRGCRFRMHIERQPFGSLHVATFRAGTGRRTATYQRFVRLLSGFLATQKASMDGWFQERPAVAEYHRFGCILTVYLFLHRNVEFCVVFG